MSSSEYLAKKYGAKPTIAQGESLNKKKKKKVKTTHTADKPGNVAIFDEEDITGQWKSVRSEDENEDEAPIVGNLPTVTFIERTYTNEAVT